MPSMRTLDRRCLRWHRFAEKTYWNPRVARPARLGPSDVIAYGHRRAWDAREAERERRQCFALYGPGTDDGPCDCLDCSGDDSPEGWELADEEDALDDEGYPWPPGVIVEHAFAERGLL